MKHSTIIRSELKAAKAVEAKAEATVNAARETYFAFERAWKAANPQNVFDGAGYGGSEFGIQFKKYYNAPEQVAWRAKQQSELFNSAERLAYVNAEVAWLIAKATRLSIAEQLTLAKAFARANGGAKLEGDVIAAVEISSGEYRIVRAKIGQSRYVAAEVSADGYIVRAIGQTGSRTPTIPGGRVLPIILLPR